MRAKITKTDTLTGETKTFDCDVSPKWVCTTCRVKIPWTDTPAPSCEKCGQKMQPLLDQQPIQN